MIGIAGGSSSGKTTVTERLAALTGDEHLSLIELDSYYLDLGDAPIEERRAVNYDHPDAFDWALLNDHLAALANGASVPVPVYDYAQHNRSDEVRMVEPARIIVVDGILVFWDRVLRERFDLKIFVDTAADSGDPFLVLLPGCNAGRWQTGQYRHPWRTMRKPSTNATQRPATFPAHSAYWCSTTENFEAVGATK